jgi:hypothetical protein
MGEGFAHVINGERRNARAGERFHFDTGLVMHAHGAANHRGIALQIDRDVAVFQSQWMTEGYEFMRALRTHDAGDDGRVEHRALRRFDCIVAQRGGDRGRESHPRFGHRGPFGWRFPADVDHGGPLFAVQV